MAQLIVRNLPDELVRRLKARAVANGRSAEQEHREIIRRALAAAAPLSFEEMLEQMPARDDEEIAREPSLPRDVEL